MQFDNAILEIYILIFSAKFFWRSLVSFLPRVTVTTVCCFIQFTACFNGICCRAGHIAQKVMGLSLVSSVMHFHTFQQFSLGFFP